MTSRKYAIFLPVRNGAVHIRLAIESVLQQEHVNWRLYVLENCSTDQTVNIVNSYSDARISIHPSKQVLGIDENWKRIDQLLTSGVVDAEMITLLGHDDVLYPNFLSLMDELYQKHPQAGLFQATFDLIDGHGALLRPCKPLPTHESSEDFLSARAWGLRDSFGTGYVFKAEDYLRVGGMPSFPALMYSDDLLFARLAVKGGKVSAGRHGCAYRLHRGSVSASLSVSKLNSQLMALRLFMNCLERDFPDFWTSDQGRDAIACLIAREVLIFDTSWLYLLLPESMRVLVKEFSKRYGERSRGVRYEQWLGSNFVTREVYATTRRLLLAWVFLKDLMAFSSSRYLNK
jgi:glycosyltransferase involved in cell wall biosynthesis